MKRRLWLPLLLILCGLLVPGVTAEQVAPDLPGGLLVEPDSIPIGMTYTGAAVRVSADIPAGYEAAIRVLGQAETLEMKRKGKVGHVLWMSVGEVTFEAVPAVYVLLTSVPLAHAAPAAVLQEWTLGYEALTQTVGTTSGLYPELVKLKQKEGCFLVGEGQLVHSGSGGSGSTDRLRGSFRLPARAPAGEYSVDLFGFHEHRAVHLASTTIHIEYTGFARLLRSVAAEHRLIYGGMAIVVAVLAGLTTGFVFHPKRGKGK